MRLMTRWMALNISFCGCSLLQGLATPALSPWAMRGDRAPHPRSAPRRKSLPRSAESLKETDNNTQKQKIDVIHTKHTQSTQTEGVK